jgi:hypothetical protein
VSYVDRGALKLFELVKKGDLKGLVVKRKDGKYSQQALWYKVLNPPYTQKVGRQEFFRDSKMSFQARGSDSKLTVEPPA